MNKKVMTLAVAGAFAAPAAAFAQASNVQIFGTMYLEYAYAKQGAIAGPSGGDLVNVDIMQTPGSEIGIKGEEALGGGTSAWFQCTSTADIRGSSQNGFCSRNSAIGMKGSWGNAYAGNWDMPMKRTAGASRIVSDTGIWGVGRMLYGDSSTFNGNATAFSFSRRQNNSLFYDSPNFGGFQGFVGISSTSTSINQTANSSGSKPRVWSVAGTYTNGPLYVTLAYEQHKNFGANNNINGGLGYNGDDHAYHAGIAYQFGPVKVGLMYVKRNYDMSANGSTDLDVDTWNLAGEWNIAGPHSLRGGYTKANDTGGSAGGTTALNPPITFGAAGGNLVANGGAGSTGGWIGQVQYVYNASKRTEYTVGYVYLSNDSNARYSLGGLSAGTIKPGETQQAFAVSMKTTF